MEKKNRKVNPNLEFYRFGGIAVSRNYATLDQVQDALAEQVTDNVMGRAHRPLGDILVAHNRITKEQMESILEELESVRA